MRPLSGTQLNRSVLARQLLLKRSRLPPHRVVERMAGVQAQYIPSAYVGLWSRMDRFTRATLTASLERRSLIQGTLMRGTIHLVSRADYWPFAAAIRGTLQDWWLRVSRSGCSREEMEVAALRVQSVLADRALKSKELIAQLDIDSQIWGGIGYWIELVRVPPSGTWDSRRADLYALASGWVGPGSADPRDGTTLLVRRYLAGFGPAAREDIRSFTGLSLGSVDEALERLRAREYVSHEGTALFDMRGAHLADKTIPAPVRFLGTWDASLLVHARRSQILPEEYRKRIFHTKAPHSFNTFLVDGQVRGTWREEGGEIRIEPFEPIPGRFQVELEEEASGLATLFRSAAG